LQTIENKAKTTLEKDIENLKGENEIAFEELEKLEELNKKLKKTKNIRDEKIEIKQTENKDIGDVLDDMIDEKKKQLEEEETELEEERQSKEIVLAKQRELQINKLEKEKREEIRRVVAVGSGGLGIGGAIASLPYIPRIIKAVRGVPIKKKRTKEDIILMNKTGIDRNEIEENKKTIENLNNRLRDEEIRNRQRDINKITMIGQQNRFNRVAINNIRGRRINVKNHIKMHNITKRRIFNI
jgi:hypothetical protein